ncbi:MAG: Hsp70 family protein, partial [Actinomycetota bacterium]
MNTGAPHLGIDLGTLRIAATVVRDGLARPVELGANGAASAALAIVGDQVVTGDAAEQVLAEHPDHGVRELQRRFGDTTPVVLDGRPFTADALAAEQMRAVAGAAGVDPGACHLTLTHPASWHDYKTDLLARTANLCGFAEVELVAAPVAVATGYLAAGHLHTGDTVAVFDLGGTLETSVVRIGEDGAAVMGTPQLLERFGGDVIDQMVFRHVTAALGGALEAMDRNDPAVRSAVMRLRAECSAAKERLSTDSEASVKVQAPGLDTEVRITRDEFEAALRPPMVEALNSLERAMASAGVVAADLAGVLLVGGGARIPVVGEMVAGHLGRRAIADLDPSMAVALGATAGAVLLAATAAAAEAAAGSAPDSAAGNAADAPSATNEQETTMSDKPNSESTPAGAAPGAPGNIPAPPPPPAKKGVGGKAAGVAAGVAAAAAAVAGAVVYGEDVVDALMGDDGTDDAAAAEALTADQAERVAEADDASMDAFDEVAPQGAATGVPLDAPSGAPAGGGQSAAPSAPQAESAGGFGRSAAPAAESPAESPAEPSVESEPPAPPAAPPAAE